MMWIQISCPKCKIVLGEAKGLSAQVVFCQNCAKVERDDNVITLTAVEAGLLTEINDGTKYWRDGYDSLLQKGMVRLVTCTNGDYAQISDFGTLVIEEFQANDYSRIV